MTDFNNFFTAIRNLTDLCNKTNFEKAFEELSLRITELTTENMQFKSQNELIKGELEILKNNHLINLTEKNNIIKDRDDELASYKKSSIIAGMNKQLMENKNYINILEQQLKQYKLNSVVIYQSPKSDIHESKSINSDNSKIPLENINIIINEPILEKLTNENINENTIELTNVVEVIDPEIAPDEVKKKKSKKEIPDKKKKKNKLDGYEYIEHDEIQYLKNVETNEIFNIIDNTIGEKVGRITSKGKIRLS